MEKSEAQDLLPRVGTTRMEIPSQPGVEKSDNPPLPCVVIEVNRRCLWYMVRFQSGVRECYKVPKVKHYTELPALNKTAVNHMVKRPRRKK
jgi:hypothetical protein